MSTQPQPGGLVVLRTYTAAEPSPSAPSYVGPFRVHEIDRAGNLTGDYAGEPARCTSRREALHAIRMAQIAVSRVLECLPESVGVYDAPGILTAVVGSDEDKRLAEIQVEVREGMREHFKRNDN